MGSIAVEDHALAMDINNNNEDPSTLHHTLPQLLEATADTHLDKIALVSTNTELSYKEYNTRANHIARTLVKRGIGRGDLVAIALDRSAFLYVTLVGVLKSGAAYMPIDISLPPERIRLMVEDAAPRLIITDGSAHGALACTSVDCLNYDQVCDSAISQADEHNLDITIYPEDIAYVIYTSGSTGKPKGVEVSHESISNFVLAMQHNMGCREDGRLLAIANISFDMANYEVYVPLVCGSTTVIARKEHMKDPRALLELMKFHDISMMIGTPTTWQMLLDAGWRGTPRLQSIMTGGENLSRSLAERLLDYADEVWNQYGPAEASVCVSVWKARKGESVSIGKPVVNNSLYILDSDLLPVPLGQSGELYIGGTGLARGYRNNPELTATRFLKHPLNGGRIYRTGDVARCESPGSVVLLGRSDGQVKIRGQRIELGDIETALYAHENVSNAVVIIRGERLTAYYTQEFDLGNATPMMSQKDFANTLRKWLETRLPSYMVPSFLVQLSDFRLTHNGKIDRKYLQNLPDPTSESFSSARPMKSLSTLESNIKDIWSKVLGHSSIDIDDNFFHIGGDSARLVKVQSTLEQSHGVLVSIANLFENYTVRALAIFVAAGSTSVKLSKETPDSFNASQHEDIAIISTACRLPGGITTPEGLWDLLETGDDIISDVPKDRWDADALYQSGTVCSRNGGFISPIDAFDAGLFGISPREARELDPAQYMMLETSWEAFERAGYTTQKLRGSRTGVYVGISNTTAYNITRQNRHLNGYSGTGTAGSVFSGRISYTFGLHGPSLTIDTACSSSLVATHLAAAALRHRECDMAVAGGVTLMASPGLHIEFSQLGGMSADGRCRAFSADADGTGWSEGCAAIVLKRLSDAQRDGDIIHAVLSSTATNHGGRSSGLTVPRASAQQELIESALESAGLHPDSIDYIEAHGTATRLGDKIELSALAEIFKDRDVNSKPLYLGSVKSNLGHTQAAAGLAGLLKVVLALRHETIPRTLYVDQPIAGMEAQSPGITIIQKDQAWIPGADRPRYAGISAFGVSGTNAHVIVREGPRAKLIRNGNALVQHGVPVLLSGATSAALRQQIQNFLDHLLVRGRNDSLMDIAFSLATTRNHFPHRIPLIAQDKCELIKKLSEVTIDVGNSPVSQQPRIAMLFTGQTKLLPDMGRGLASQFPVFRDTLQEVADHFSNLLDRPLLEVMWSDTACALLQRVDYAQPALFAVQVALWRLWDCWGVRPQVLQGHSAGELACAYVAGIMNLPDACRLVAVRGRLMYELLSSKGVMVSLDATVHEVEEGIKRLSLSSQVDVACQNSPTQTVASGDPVAIHDLISYFSVRDRKSKVLESCRAFHSYHVDAISGKFLEVLRDIEFSPPDPSLTIVSTLTGNAIDKGELEQPSYWIRQARSTVLFCNGIRTLFSLGVSVFLELGPLPILSSIGAACVPDDMNAASMSWLPSLDYKKPDLAVINRALATLYSLNVTIDWAAYYQPFRCSRVELPTYAFQRARIDTDMDLKRTHSTASSYRAASTKSLEKEDIGSIDKFLFEVRWIETSERHHLKSGTWGLLMPPTNSSTQLPELSALQSAGIQLRPVKQVQDAVDMDGLLCFWDLEQSTMDIPNQTRDLATNGLQQLQDAAKMCFKRPIIWVTNSAICTNIEEVASGLTASPLFGLMRTARLEHPELTLRLIDLGSVESLARDLATALALATEPECAVRQGRLLVPRMHQVRDHTLDPVASEPLLRQDGAVIITGGFGSIGRRVATWLARVHGIRDLVLVSRRGMASPGAVAFLEELSKMDVQVEVKSVDIGDFSGVQSLVAEFDQLRPLRGVVHTAGTIDDGVLTSLTPQKCHSVMRAKVDGAYNLHCATKHLPLDMFVLFSSLSGVLGNAGQGNYAAANTFLDALANSRHAQGLPAVSIAWGLWDAGGMGSTLDASTRARYARLGIDPLDPEDGMLLCERVIRRKLPLAIPVAYNLVRLRDYYGQQFTGIPPIFTDLLDQSPTQASRATKSQDLREALSDYSDEQQQSMVLETVRETIAKALGFTNSSEVDVDVPLQELGLDSLTAIFSRNQLTAVTNLTLSPRIVFDHANLRSLGRYILSRLRDETDLPAASHGLSPELERYQRGVLDESITFDNTTGSIAQPKKVFVTGSTGFVGAFMVHELLRQNISVYCLIRASNLDQARQRLIKTLQTYELWKPDYESLINVITGDISKPLLGLSKETFNELADRVDSICHIGARVDWMLPKKDYIGPNIISTHEVLHLASCGRSKAIHFISTVAVVPRYLGCDLSESDTEYNYATSKYIAEQLIVAARWRGANASIYRMPFITASSAGQFRRDKGDFLHNMIAGSLEMGMFPSLTVDLAMVLPVDYLCQTVVSIATQDLDRAGQDFNFANPQAPSFDTFFKMMSATAASPNQKDELVPYSKWRDEALTHAAKNPHSLLARIATVLDGCSEETAVAMFQAPKLGRVVLGGDLYPAPAMNEKYVQNYCGRIQAAETASLG